MHYVFSLKRPFYGFDLTYIKGVRIKLRNEITVCVANRGAYTFDAVVVYQTSERGGVVDRQSYLVLLFVAASVIGGCDDKKIFCSRYIMDRGNICT